MMAASEDYPPAPWRLHGEAAIVGVPIREEVARRSAGPPGSRLVTAAGWTLGGTLLARYDERATLPYHELIVFSGLARVAGRLGFVVSHIYVDSLPSLRGGHEIWGLPKELAEFTWTPGSVSVAQDGRKLLLARFRHRARRLLVPVYAPVFGDHAGVTLHAAGRGGLRGGPALAELQVPATSPFAALGLTGRHLGVAGDELALRFPAGLAV